MIRNILFDMGGVIMIQNTDEARRRFREMGIDPDVYMGEYGQKEFFFDLEAGLITPEEFCRKMAEATGREAVSYDEASYCWTGFIADVPIERLKAVDALRSRYHVGLLSNTNPFVMKFVRSDRFCREGKPIDAYFDSIFASCEMKAYKPDARIFRLALEADGMLAEETVFVDDSAKNIAAAEALGIHGLLVPQNADWSEPLARLLAEIG